MFVRIGVIDRALSEASEHIVSVRDMVATLPTQLWTVRTLGRLTQEDVIEKLGGGWTLSRYASIERGTVEMDGVTLGEARDLVDFIAEMGERFAPSEDVAELEPAEVPLLGEPEEADRDITGEVTSLMFVDSSGDAEDWLVDHPDRFYGVEDEDGDVFVFGYVSGRVKVGYVLPRADGSFLLSDLAAAVGGGMDLSLWRQSNDA